MADREPCSIYFGVKRCVKGHVIEIVEYALAVTTGQYHIICGRVPCIGTRPYCALERDLLNPQVPLDVIHGALCPRLSAWIHVNPVFPW